MLVISEIMHNPRQEPDWEWIEIYNAGNTSVDLSGYVLDDDDNSALSAANIASGSIAAGETAILFNAKNITAADFTAAWGTGINLIAVTNWSQLNNTNDKISIWSSLASYEGDKETHTNAVDTVNYSTGFPSVNGSSVYLTDLNADNNIVENWSLSTVGGVTPTGTGYASKNTVKHDGGEIASAGGFLDTTPPPAPIINNFSINTGNSDIDSITTDNTLVVMGSGEANSTIELFLDGVSLNITTIDDSTDGFGNWEFDYTDTMLPVGTYSFTATATDTSGNVSATSTDFNFTIESFSGNGSKINGSNIKEQLIGTVNDDLINGGYGRDRLYGNAGDDTLSGDEGNDELYGRNGDDLLSGDTGSDVLQGERGNDTLQGGSGIDKLSGGIGNDTLIGGVGIDYIWETGDVDFTLTDTELIGLGGIDTFQEIERARLTGGKSNNNFDASSFSLGPVSLYGRGGNDNLSGGSDDDNLFGEIGNDRLNGNNGNDLLSGGSGNDDLDGGAGIDEVWENADTNFSLTDSQLLGIGTDSLINIEQAKLFGRGSDNTIDASGFTLGSVYLYGNNGNDILLGGSANDYLYGGQNNDQITGNAGDDYLNGDRGDDTLNGSSGLDRLFGNAGNDSLSGGTENDYLVGEDGTDILSGGDGDDELSGGAGDDNLDGGTGNDNITETADVDFILTNSQLLGNGTDSLVSVEEAKLYAGDSNNTIDASTFTLGSVYLYGFGGDDIITSGTGDDELSGGRGDDNLDGGVGIDYVRDSANVDFTLTDSQLTGNGTDSLVNIERARLFGGSSKNNINASAFTGSVFLYGYDGNDNLIGGSADDELGGGEGDDKLDGGAGVDYVWESADIDFILTDSQLTGNGKDSLVNIERARLFGGESDNIIDASAFTLGSTYLYGNEGKDNLIGGSGDDFLFGGLGDDSLTGGTGADIFTVEPDSGSDIINDFEDGTDKLSLSNGINFNDLNINNISGNTEITFNSQVLTTLFDIDSTSIDVNDFVI